MVITGYFPPHSSFHPQLVSTARQTGILPVRTDSRFGFCCGGVGGVVGFQSTTCVMCGIGTEDGERCFIESCIG